MVWVKCTSGWWPVAVAARCTAAAALRHNDLSSLPFGWPRTL
ncbi:MAG TPA: hypothetical protein VNO31_21875 [Umezawaea sp.]|nr:hypothetical protein [Umezawaea sp.]